MYYCYVCQCQSGISGDLKKQEVATCDNCGTQWTRPQLELELNENSMYPVEDKDEV